MMGPHGFENHSIVLAKSTNTVARYPQEGTVYTLIGLVASRLKTVSDTTYFLLTFDLILQVCYKACKRLK